MDSTAEIVKILSATLKEVTTTFIEQVALMEKNHWEQLEKQSTKQLQILEKQTKDFIGVMGDFIEASKPIQPPPPLVPDIHTLDKVLERENTIEKEELEEQSLDQIERIPMTDGIKVQFEGEELIHDINIS